jgi:predicted permease
VTITGRFGEVLWYDTRYALRGMRRRPGFTAMIVVTLTLGIGANTIMFGMLDQLLLRPPAHIVDANRVVLMHVGKRGDSEPQTTQAYVFSTMMKEAVPDFADVAVATPTSVVRRQYFPVGRGPTATRAAGALVSGNYFSLLGVRPAVGRFFLPDEETVENAQKLAVLGYGYWERQFGGRGDVLGKTIEVGTERYTIVGVAPRGFTGTELRDVDLWLPITAANGLRFAKAADWSTSTNSQWLLVLARLKPGVAVERAEAEASAAYRNWARSRMTNPTAERLARLDSETVRLGSIIPGKSLWAYAVSGSPSDVRVGKLLGGVALMVLLIACANVANLLLVRALGRRREIAVRLALGVNRRRLIAQLMIEGVLLAVLGAAGALAVAVGGAQLVRTWLVGDGAWSGGIINVPVLAFTAVVALASGVFTSLVPAIQTSRPDLASALKAGSREGAVQRSRTRTGLLAAQVALAIVLLTGAGLFVKSLRNVAAIDLGVDTDRVLVAQIAQASVGLTNEQSLELFEQFAARARQLPSVTRSAVTVGLPFSLSWSTRAKLVGRETPKPKNGIWQYAVTPEYFDVVGVRVLSGRAISTADRANASPVVVVNSALARLYWPNEAAVGQCLRVGADTAPCSTVIGVVSNTHRQDLVEEQPVPQLYRPLDQITADESKSTVSFFGYTLVVRTSGDAASTIEPLRQALQSVNPNVPYADVQTMRMLLGRQTRSWELGARVFSAFGSLALLLASVGLFSVVAFMLGQRMHEFGVRRALGAQSGDLLSLGVRRGLGPVVAGIAVGVALTLGLGRFVDPLLFKESSRDPWVLSASVLVLFVAALLASVIPARRAAVVDPTIALRTE